MSSVEELLCKQMQTLRSIDRVLANFKKLGQAKMTAATTQNRMTMLKEAYLQSQALDAKIEATTDEKMRSTLPYFTENRFIESEERYQEALDHMAEVLAKVTSSLESSTANTSLSNMMTSQPTVHLPRIQLPTFSGAFKDWESFRDRFTSMVINNYSLSNVERLHFLCSSLTGEASQAVSHLQITDHNFDIAWKVITSRYENKQLLISTHLKTLFSLPTVTNENPRDLCALRDGINVSLEMLRNLKRPVDMWDDLIVYMAAQKLDRASRKAWEFQLSEITDFPTYAEFDSFLEKRIRALKAIPNVKSDDSSDRLKPKRLVIHSAITQKFTCPVCQKAHLIYQCAKFLSQPVSERFRFIRKQNRCVNCFSIKHPAAQCQSKHACKECNQRHNTLLHFPSQKNEVPPSSTEEHESSNSNVEISTNVASELRKTSCVLLSTARVQIRSHQGRCVKARALLDQGSVATLITEHLAQSLHLPRSKQPTKIIGVGENYINASHVANIIVTPANSNHPAYSTTAIIMRSLTRYVPCKTESKFKRSYFLDLELADSDPMSSEPIDIIIGADLYGQLLMPGLRTGSACIPTAQQTSLGWILSGPLISNSSPPSVNVHHLSILEHLDHTLRQFWEVEAITAPPILSSENQKCEHHFQATHTRSSDGRYIVRLPFKTQTQVELGDSRAGALRCLLSLENRLKNDTIQANSYREFLAEYEALGHMAQADPLPSSEKHCYFIPHHAVVRETSLTTRLRVVFNASRKTRDGSSLNQHLLTGPKLQQDLVAVILRWRHFQYVYTADIEKMYRQIRVHDSDTNYQRILWRDSPHHPINEYKLLTVTYGTAPAPYLALRVLHQLTDDDGMNYPKAISIVRQQAYVDDFLFGGDELNSVRELRDQTIALLSKGGFTLRKWSSNHPMLLSDVNPEFNGLATNKSLKVNDTISVLGLSWNPVLDNFQFKISVPTNSQTTKRSILSIIAKLFDPLGWISPFVITAKVFMQTLWSLHCDWDDVLPSEILNEWQHFRSQLPNLEHLSIPRKISTHPIKIQSLHGFSDASTKAYAAVIYSRCVLHDGTVEVCLLISKTRVAPVKTMSVPRLELSAALLLARLLNYVLQSLNAPSIESHCWTDSTITLAWLSHSPARWKTFVANRVSKIQELTPNANWHYIPTGENPSDCASRGMSVDDLKNHLLWWSGPSWLRESLDSWPQDSAQDMKTQLEEKNPAIFNLTTNIEQWDLAHRYSSWTKLLRITAYILKFVNKIRTRNQERSKLLLTVSHQRSKISSPFLKPVEIQQAKTLWLKRLQSDVFPEETKALVQSQPIPKTSPLRSLTPYLDGDGLIRVKGRLANSELAEKAKYPVILRSHPLLTLLIESTHRKLLHAGSQLTLASLRSEYWILRARATVRQILYRCIACTRERAILPTELMGNLPAPRVTKMERAFVHTGVDYAGPIQIRTAAGRGYKSQKAYIAIFVCLTVKAIHIECVSDYTSAAFLAAYQRFTSRRGLPKAMYSDNGTTFQGANRELMKSFHLAVKNADFGNRLATDGIEWHFLPPNAPHFGGLWEAAVKSMKYHLKRSVGTHTLTFEEITTVLCRIEACLNSRPLGPISECIDDYRVLTPGHFLIGTPIVTPPEPSVLELRDNRLSRWQLVQKLTESFWKSWSNDYLHTLHQRPKWRTTQNLAKVGQIVLIRNPNLPPCRWELARITACHPGQDGLVRVVSVKTATTEYKRPIVKLCFLPISINADNGKFTPPN